MSSKSNLIAYFRLSLHYLSLSWYDKRRANSLRERYTFWNAMFSHSSKRTHDCIKGSHGSLVIVVKMSQVNTTNQAPVCFCFLTYSKASDSSANCLRRTTIHVKKNVYTVTMRLPQSVLNSVHSGLPGIYDFGLFWVTYIWPYNPIGSSRAGMVLACRLRGTHESDNGQTCLQKALNEVQNWLKTWTLTSKPLIVCKISIKP